MIDVWWDDIGLSVCLHLCLQGSVCHPYLSLSYYDILEDVNIRSFVIGASNVLFKQKKQNIDVLVEVNMITNSTPSTPSLSLFYFLGHSTIHLSFLLNIVCTWVNYLVQKNCQKWRLPVRKKNSSLFAAATC